MRQPAPSAFSPAVPSPPSRAEVEVEYPSSDGKRMSENDFQRAVIVYGLSALGLRYRARSDVYVSGDLLVYYEEGNPRARVAPDVFVVFGVEDRMRMNYKVWEEGKGPDFVLEVASPGTWREHVGPNRGVYAELGVKDYCLYDPTGKHLKPALWGYRLAGGGYERQPLVESPDGTRSLYSETLGLDLWAKGGKMRFRDPNTGLDLLSYEEEHAARQAAVVRAEREAALRRDAEVQAEREAAARRAGQDAAARRDAEIRTEREAAARQQDAAARRDAEIRTEREAAARQQDAAARRDAEIRTEREAAARQQDAAARRAAEARIAELEALLDAKRG